MSLINQRIVYSDINSSLSQSLALSAVVGSNVLTKIYNVDVKCGSVHAYSDALSQANAGADGSHRMKQSLKVFKPDVRPTVPAYAECMRKRLGTADEPVIEIDSGGDKSINGCSLLGREDDLTNTWSFTAKADNPNTSDTTSTYAWVWNTGGGSLTAGTAGAGNSGGSASITVKYTAGRHVPTLTVFRTFIDPQFHQSKTEQVGRAEVHAIAVYSKTVDGTSWTTPVLPDDQTYGSKGKLKRYTDDGVGVNVTVAPDVKVQGTVRARMSSDGYPQNEYWVTAGDSGDLPQPYAFAPETEKPTWVQGYAVPSASADDLSVRVKGSKSYGDDTTDVKFSTLLMEENVDANRDQHITFDGKDTTSVVRPYRFWLNNNHDAVVTNQSPGGYTEEDDLSDGVPDSADSVISCRRDLEDFARIWMTMSNRNVLGSRLRSSDVQMSFSLRAISGAPQARLFLAADPDGGLGYLTDYEGISHQQALDPTSSSSNARYHNAAATVPSGSLVTMQVPGGSSLSDALVSDANAPDGTRTLAPFIFEGVASGIGELNVKLTMTIDGQQVVVGHSRVVLDLRDIKQFYEQYSLGDTPMVFASQTPQHVPGSLVYDNNDDYFSDNHYLLFIHGWNMTTADKAHFADCGYKRLWWNGYKGRFGALHWPTRNGFTAWFDPLTQPQNYDDSEYIAWQAGERLAAWLPSLSQTEGCPIDLQGHSMGNVVVGNALRVLSAGQEGSVGTYIASQAAVPEQVYFPDGTTGAITWSPTFLGYSSWNTASVYTGFMGNTGQRFKISNFNNANDYALGVGVSGLNQLFKPDQGKGDYMPGPSGLIDHIPVDEFRDRFYRRTGDFLTDGDHRSPEYVDLYFWNGTTLSAQAAHDYDFNGFIPRSYFQQPVSNYYTMAYLSESRVHPLGASPGAAFVSASVSLNSASIWPLLKADNTPSGDPPYSTHRWHSGQFRMTMPEQKEYWKSLMTTCGYSTANALP